MGNTILLIYLYLLNGNRDIPFSFTYSNIIIDSNIGGVKMKKNKRSNKIVLAIIIIAIIICTWFGIKYILYGEDILARNGEKAVEFCKEMEDAGQLILPNNEIDSYTVEKKEGTLEFEIVDNVRRRTHVTMTNDFKIIEANYGKENLFNIIWFFALDIVAIMVLYLYVSERKKDAGA